MQSLPNVGCNTLRVYFFYRHISTNLFVLLHVAVGLSVFVSTRYSLAFSAFWCSTHQVSYTVFCQCFMFCCHMIKLIAHLLKKIHYLIPMLRFDFHTLHSLWQVDHVSVSQTKKSLAELCILAASYLKLSLCWNLSRALLKLECD